MERGWGRKCLRRRGGLEAERDGEGKYERQVYRRWMRKVEVDGEEEGGREVRKKRDTGREKMGLRRKKLVREWEEKGRGSNESRRERVSARGAIKERWRVGRVVVGEKVGEKERQGMESKCE